MKLPTKNRTHATAQMTMSVVQNVLRNPEDLQQTSQQLLHTIRQLSGALTIILVQYLRGEDGGTGIRILGVNPLRRHHLADTAEVRRLLEIIYESSKICLWNPQHGQKEVEVLLKKLRCGLSCGFPLLVGTECTGGILVLDLPDDYHTPSIVNILGTLTGVTAVVLKNAFLIEELQRNIEDRKLAEENLHKMQQKLETLVKERTTELMLKVDELQREKAERRKSEQNYRTIFNATNEAIFIHEPATGKILDFNRSALDMFGYSSEEVQNISVSDLSSGEEPYTGKTAGQLMQQTVQEGSRIMEWHARRKNGELFWVEIARSCSMIGEHERVLAVVRDISKRKQMEADGKKLEA
ncbi:PAS domain S-box protein [Candidatus Riflebacteria bacterium]